MNFTGESAQENGTNTFNLVLSAKGCLMIAGSQGCDFMFYLIAPLQCCCCWETSLQAQRGECLCYYHVKFFRPSVDCDSCVPWGLIPWKGRKHIKFAEREKLIWHSAIMRTIHFVGTEDKCLCLADPREGICYSTLWLSLWC